MADPESCGHRNETKKSQEMEIDIERTSRRLELLKKELIVKISCRGWIRMIKHGFI